MPKVHLYGKQIKSKDQRTYKYIYIYIYAMGITLISLLLTFVFLLFSMDNISTIIND